MPKYYRVRTQEQWDWLMQWFEEQDIRWTDGTKPNSAHKMYTKDMVVKEDNQSLPLYASCYFFDVDQQITDYIEVSQMMEDEKTEEYVTIDAGNVEKLKNEEGDSLFYTIDKQYFVSSFMEGFECSEVNIPKSLLYPKVRMNVAEKKEFDDVKKHVTALYNAMVLIFEHRDECINLNNKLFYSAPPKYLNDVQRDFARAWNDESLIEVIPDKKWNVKVPPFERTNKYYYKFGEKLRWAGRVGNDDEDQQFTADELKEYGLDDDMYEKVEVKE